MTARVLVTRASTQAASLEAALRDARLEPVRVPAIAVEIDPPGGRLDNAARVLHTFDWVVMTSANGARAILTAAERISTALGTPSWAAIGETTAAVLEREGIDVDFLPSRPEANAMGEELPLDAGEEVLLLRGDLGGPALATRLRERGAAVMDVVAYRTIEAPPSSRGLLRRAIATGRPDAVLFASGSAARGLFSLAEAEGIDISPIPAVCIGPETAIEAERLGFRVLATSSERDAASLAATTAAALAEPVEAR